MPAVLQTIRTAQPEDAEVLAALHREARCAAMPWLPVIHTPDQDRAFFLNTVMRNCQMTLIEDNNQLIAYMATRPGWIDHMYVAQSHWRQGIGRRLVTLAQALQSSVQLWTFQRNTAARNFYTSLGFKEVEMTNGSQNEEKEPDVRLLWVAS